MHVEQTEQMLTMYTTTWCGDGARSKAFLKRHGVPYREVNIEQHADAAETVRALNNGFSTVPTIVFPDGSILAEPSNHELAAKLALSRAPTR